MNRFSKYFDKNMSEHEAIGIFFKLAKDLPEDDLKELNDAYEPISNAIVDREIRYAHDNHMMTAY